MSKAKILFLDTPIYRNETKSKALAALTASIDSTIFVVDSATMQDTDWDRVLDAILDHDRCITL